MNIYITTIAIQSISNVGSLNIGKTILSHNKASSLVGQTIQSDDPDDKADLSETLPEAAEETNSSGEEEPNAEANDPPTSFIPPPVP